MIQPGPRHLSRWSDHLTDRPLFLGALTRSPHVEEKGEILPLSLPGVLLGSARCLPQQLGSSSFLLPPLQLGWLSSYRRQLMGASQTPSAPHHKVGMAAEAGASHGSNHAEKALNNCVHSTSTQIHCCSLERTSHPPLSSLHLTLMCILGRPPKNSHLGYTVHECLQFWAIPS